SPSIGSTSDRDASRIEEKLVHNDHSNRSAEYSTTVGRYACTGTVSRTPAWPHDCKRNSGGITGCGAKAISATQALPPLTGPKLLPTKVQRTTFVSRVS